MKKTINPSWTRFVLSIACIGVFPALLIAAGMEDRDSWLSIAATCFLFVSLAGFFSRGWARLRKEHAIKPILPSETDRIRQILIGPVVPAIIWFTVTILVVIVVVIVTVFSGRAT